MKTIERDGKIYLVDDESIAKVQSDCIDLNERLAVLGGILKAVKINASERNLRGLMTRGKEFVYDAYDDMIRKETSGTHFAQRSIQRMIDEAIAELPAEQMQMADNWRNGFKAEVVPLLPSEIEFADGRLVIGEAYLKRAESLFTHEVTDAEADAVDKFCELVDGIRELTDAGFNVTTIVQYYYSPDGKPQVATKAGIVEQMAVEKDNAGAWASVDRGHVLNLLLKSKHVVSCDNHLKV